MNIENVIEATEHLTGFVIVMLALTVLWGLTAFMGRRFTAAAAKAPAPKPVSVPEAAPSEADDDLVVVAAAAAVMLESSHRIVAVRPVVSSWGQQGRRDIHASHRIR